MPELDYAFLCDYVRAEQGLAHVIAAGIDTIIAAQVPTGRNLGFVARIAFTRQECGREHRFELVVLDAEGERLAQVEGAARPEWNETLPPGWRTPALIGLNLGVPLPRFGEYAVEILINSASVKSLPLRVIEPPRDQ